MAGKITVDALTRLFSDKVTEVKEEPEFQRTEDKVKYAVDNSGEPQVKLAIGNVPLDYDLWQGLRNPATVGLFPAGIPEIWEYYANRKKPKIDDAGRPSIFQVPRSFENARDNYNRAVIISVMLPFSNPVISDYIEQVIDKSKGSSHLFTRMYEDVNAILDKATTRAAIELITEDTEKVVVAMNNDTVTRVSEEAIPETHRGTSHGPSKGGNYPQKSVAVLMGLGQFGISRIIFRDELIDGKVQRFTGPIRSIVIFDKEEVVKDGKGGVIYPSEDWRQLLTRLYDFTDIDAGINKYRFCSYVPLNDSGCDKCLDYCPSGALLSSTPGTGGEYTEQVTRQAHRFWENKLQFDYGRCCDERGQMAGLLPEWSCARCVSICVDRGVRRKLAAGEFYQKMAELTTGQKAVQATA